MARLWLLLDHRLRHLFDAQDSVEAERPVLVFPLVDFTHKARLFSCGKQVVLNLYSIGIDRSPSVLSGL